VKKKLRYVFDLETNDLLDKVTEIWIAVVIDLATGKEYIFSDHVSLSIDGHINSLSAFLPFLEEADEISGHNIIGFDLPVLKKLANWEPPEEMKIVDTMLLSQMMDYKRFGFGHSLEKWAESFGMKKTEVEKWDQWDDIMIERCLVDTRVNVKTYNKVKEEVIKKAKTKPSIKKSVAAEHATALFFAKAKERGWLIDTRKLKRLKKRMEDQLEAIRTIVEPQMLGRIKPKDGLKFIKGDSGDKIGKTRTPVYKKNGEYNLHTSRMFEIEGCRGLTDRPIAGEYTPIIHLPPDINSNDSVKQFLYSIGWKPLEWNRKKVGRRWVDMSPKLCETSLHKLGRVGDYISRYGATSSRYSILKGWEENLDADDRLHGDAFVIGTPTFRCRHKVIVNVPSAGAVWGKGMRALFICDEGNVIVGADSSGNQARALCHYVNDKEFTKLWLEGDLHQRNADILECSRSKSKRFLYAFLFGCGDAKLGMYLTGTPNASHGKKMKEKFERSLPQLSSLIEKLEKTFDKTLLMSDGKKGYIPAIDGRRVYSDSKHKLLNYLLQSMEAVTCKAAVLYAMEKFKEEKIPYYPLTHQHDEYQLSTPKEYSKRVAEIMEESFREAPKWYDINIMDGESLIGCSWRVTH